MDRKKIEIAKSVADKTFTNREQIRFRGSYLAWKSDLKIYDFFKVLHKSGNVGGTFQIIDAWFPV